MVHCRIFVLYDHPFWLTFFGAKRTQVPSEKALHMNASNIRIIFLIKKSRILYKLNCTCLILCTVQLYVYLEYYICHQKECYGNKSDIHTRPPSEFSPAKSESNVTGRYGESKTFTETTLLSLASQYNRYTIKL